MKVLLYALIMAAVLALVANIGWTLIRGLRTGNLPKRMGGGVVQRRTHPFAYWTSFAAGCLVIAMMLMMTDRLALILWALISN
jgi:hypothetical protein